MSATAGNAFPRRRRTSAWTERDRSTASGEARLDSWVDADRTWGAEWRTSALGARVWNEVLLDPIRDILGRPGKSFRANLVRACFALVNEDAAPPPELPAALEILHAGSLIVDDIADDSHERRGGPCIHRVHGTPRALNAGNYMYFWALELLADLPLPAGAGRALLRRANRTMLDCHRGQALDIGLQVGAVPKEALFDAAAEISALKTGALMSLAAYAGAVAAGASPEQERAAERFGGRLGVVLQKLDDLGNLTSRHAPGKRFEDLRAGRVTWAWAWAAEALDAPDFAALERRAQELRRACAAAAAATQPGSVEGAGAALEAEMGSLAEDLLLCAGLHRRNDLRAELGEILGALEVVFGDKPALRILAAEMERLEASYG
jgi:geranylgeranyl pyrophosphate synthase